MKKITIEVRIPEGENEDKVATVIKTNGYSNTNVSHQFELLGIVENVKNIINERIKKLSDVRK